MKIFLFMFVIFLSFFAFSADLKRYQVGTEWRRVKSTKWKSRFDPLFVNALNGVAKFVGGTAFYIGKIENRHIMMTNFHVLKNNLNCYGLNPVLFRHLGLSYKCKKHIISYSDIETSFFEIDVPKDQERKLKKMALRLDPFEFLTKESELITLGMGGINNIGQKFLTINDDNDCHLFTTNTKKINDPDIYHPANYQVFSLPTGCDISHGDSGSPVLLKETGRVIGINWTGGTKKSEKIFDSNFLDNLFENDPIIWKELSYMVSMKDIFQYLRKNLESSEDLSKVQREFLEGLLKLYGM